MRLHTGDKVRYSRRVVGFALVAGMFTAGSVGALSAQATTSPVVFDGTPGSTLGGYPMTAFPADSLPVWNGTETSIPAPGGASVGVSYPVERLLGSNIFGGWSDPDASVYVDPSISQRSVTLTLPAGVAAFSFYAESDECGYFTVTATTDDGTTSGPQPTQTCIAGPHYFGFYTTDGSSIQTVTLTTSAPSYDILFGAMAENAAAPANLSGLKVVPTGRRSLYTRPTYDLAVSATSPTTGRAVPDGQLVTFSTTTSSGSLQQQTPLKTLGTATTRNGTAAMPLNAQQLSQLRLVRQIAVTLTPSGSQDFSATTNLFPAGNLIWH